MNNVTRQGTSISPSGLHRRCRRLRSHAVFEATTLKKTSSTKLEIGENIEVMSDCTLVNPCSGCALEMLDCNVSMIEIMNRLAMLGCIVVNSVMMNTTIGFLMVYRPVNLENTWVSSANMSET